jgi:hypothetical protein
MTFSGASESVSGMSIRLSLMAVALKLNLMDCYRIGVPIIPLVPWITEFINVIVG